MLILMVMVVAMVMLDDDDDASRGIGISRGDGDDDADDILFWNCLLYVSSDVVSEPIFRMYLHHLSSRCFVPDLCSEFILCIHLHHSSPEFRARLHLLRGSSNLIFQDYLLTCLSGFICRTPRSNFSSGLFFRLALPDSSSSLPLWNYMLHISSYFIFRTELLDLFQIPLPTLYFTFRFWIVLPHLSSQCMFCCVCLIGSS